jgi:hypothetical protein
MSMNTSEILTAPAVDGLMTLVTRVGAPFTVMSNQIGSLRASARRCQKTLKAAQEWSVSEAGIRLVHVESRETKNGGILILTIEIERDGLHGSRGVKAMAACEVNVRIQRTASRRVIQAKNEPIGSCHRHEDRPRDITASHMRWAQALLGLAIVASPEPAIIGFQAGMRLPVSSAEGRTVTI